MKTLLNMSAVEEKYFMSIFFSSLMAMEFWSQKLVYALVLIIKIIFLITVIGSTMDTCPNLGQPESSLCQLSTYRH